MKQATQQRMTRQQVLDSIFKQVHGQRTRVVQLPVNPGDQDVGLMDRFSGALIITGSRAEVDAAMEENLRFFRDDLHFRVCTLSQQ